MRQPAVGGEILLIYRLDSLHCPPGLHPAERTYCWMEPIHLPMHHYQYTHLPMHHLGSERMGWPICALAPWSTKQPPWNPPRRPTNRAWGHHPFIGKWHHLGGWNWLLHHPENRRLEGGPDTWAWRHLSCPTKSQSSVYRGDKWGQ